RQHRPGGRLRPVLLGQHSDPGHRLHDHVPTGGSGSELLTSAQECTMHLPCTVPPIRLALLVVAALALGGLVSCNSRNLHKVYPVKGKIQVTGQPANECQVYLHRTFDDDHSFRVTPQGLTDKNGEFQITSYHAHDGAPEGEYVVTIEWRERS